MKTGTGLRKDKLPHGFTELNRVLPLRPIDDEVSLDNAQEMVDALALLRRRTADQEDYLETLSTLIEKYEDEHHPIKTSHLDPMEALAFLMEQNHLNSSQLGEILGQRQLGSKILTRARELSKAHIVKLSHHFKVSPAVFFQIPS
jgi:HTH-type transcriptional regulator / antitoxin HigA